MNRQVPTSSAIIWQSVTEPIRLHVPAKRYLSCRQGFLSPVIGFGNHRKGADDEEVDSFEQNPWYQDAVRLRRYDDDGKVEGLAIEPVESYRDLLSS